MRNSVVVGVVLFATLGACGDDDGGGGGGDGGTQSDANPDTGGGGGNLVDGTIVLVGGGTAPADGKTFVLWSSDIGQGDFLYKWGEGTATATAFTANVTAPVPNDATFGGLLGVGIVVLTASGTTIADGVVNENLQTIALGFTGEYAIIFRPNANPVPEATWANDFPVGLSCGRCVEQQQGFDTFTPVPCSEMKLQVGPLNAVTSCNWT